MPGIIKTIPHICEINKKILFYKKPQHNILKYYRENVIILHFGLISHYHAKKPIRKNHSVTNEEDCESGIV